MESNGMEKMNRLLANLQALKMTTAAKELPQLLTRAVRKNLDTLDVLDELLARETAARRERRIERRIRRSHLPDIKTLDDYEWNFPAKIDRHRIQALARLDFVRERLNVIFTGKSGTGKSHLAQSLAFLACGQEFRVLYTTCADMLGKLYAALADHTLGQVLRRYTRVDLLVVDDLGTEKVEILHGQGASLFFKVINERYGKASTIITSNLSTSKWAAYFGDPNVTVAALDRFTHHAIPIVIDGPSYRVKMMQDRLRREARRVMKTKKPEKKRKSDKS